jgi:hypothetical protein
MKKEIQIFIKHGPFMHLQTQFMLELEDNQNKAINLKNHDTFSFYIDERRKGRY